MAESDENEENKNSLEFAIGEKDDVVICVMKGKVNGRQLHVLEQCQAAVSTKLQPIIIFDFQGVSEFMPAGYEIWAKTQKELRDNGKLIALCGLNQVIKNALLSSGIVRDRELYSTVPEAWKNLKNSKKEEESK